MTNEAGLEFEGKTKIIITRNEINIGVFTVDSLCDTIIRDGGKIKCEFGGYDGKNMAHAKVEPAIPPKTTKALPCVHDKILKQIEKEKEND